MSASVVASVVLTCVWACSSSSEPAAPSCAATEIIAAASDYSSSVVCGAPPCEIGPRTAGVALGRDPSLAASNGRVFFLARSTDLIFELDPACGLPTKQISVHQDDVEKLVNAHDVAAAPDGSLFVVLYNVPRIVVFKDGEQDGPPIDLSSYDDDKNPQADAIRIVDVAGVPKAFVTLERLDDTQPGLRSRQPSQMLRIDVATRQVEATIELAGRNPFNPMAELNGSLFLAEPGNFDSDDDPQAGIERFDTAASTTRLLVTEKDLGGSVSEVAVTEGCGVAIVAGKETAVNPTSLVTFDPATGRVLSRASAPILATPGYDLQGLAWRNDTLYVGDRRKAAVGFQVHAFERTQGTCILHETGRGVTLPQRPVAIRAAR
ncbi:hypothetical protein BH11MYX4_BH11MYX4_13500 [soil metagenome]